MSEERIKSEEDDEQPLSAEELDIVSGGVEQGHKKTDEERQK
jgi:hypothetical protein